LLEPAAARKNYLHRFNAHLERLRGMCARHGVEYRVVRTDAPLEQCLFDFLSARSRLTARHRTTTRSAA
jgi:hypothetical protein